MAGKTLKTRVLTCPNCGAKLHWDRDAPVIECRYCQTHVLVENGRRTDRPTNVISTPAPPPEFSPAPSSRPSARARVGVIAATMLAVGTTTIVAVTQSSRSSTRSSTPAPPKMSTTAELAALDLATTPEAVAAKLGARRHEMTVTVLLSDGEFSEAVLSWDKAHLDHVHAVALRPRAKEPAHEALVARARAQIGRRLRPAAAGGHQFHAKAAFFSVATNVNIHANPERDPRWKEQFAAMWTVMKGAALGTADTLDDRTKRDVLNIAYPLETLAQIPFTTIVDDAARELARIAPGVDSDGERHHLGLAHPWFESVTLRWENKPNGAWTNITMYFPVDAVPSQEAVAACVTPVLGEPKKLVADHLAGTFNLQFRAKGGTPWVDLGQQTFQIYPRYSFGDPVTEAGLHALIAALAACGT